MNLQSQDTPARETPDRRARMRAEQAGPRAERSSDEDEISFAELVATAWASKWTIVGVAVLLVSLAGFYVFTSTRLYTATASLVLEVEQQNIMNLEGFVPGLSSEQEAMNTELLVLRSRRLLGQVVDTLLLQEDPEFNPALRPVPAWKEWIGYNSLREALGLVPDARAAEEMRDDAIEILKERKLAVSIVPKTFAIEISIETQSPEKSANIANELARLYLREQRDTKFTSMDEAMRWLSQRVAELKEELEVAEGKVREYAAEAAVLTEDRLMLDTDKLKRLRDELASKREAVAELRQRIESLDSLYARGDFATIAEVIKDPELGELAGNLAGANTESPSRAQFEELFEARLQQLRAEKLRSERQVRSLTEGVSDLESALRAQSSDFVKLQQLQREAEATRLIYEHSLARMKEISLQQGIQQADARVLDPAKNPDEPSHPKTVQIMLAGGVLGSLLGLLFVFMRDALRTTFQSVEELEEFARLPVIGLIPEAHARRPVRLLEEIVEKPASPVAEALRNLRTAVELSNLDDIPQVLMVTSSIPGEGKSTVAAGIAETAALSGKRVLLIDGDLRRRTLKKYFQIQEDAGILKVLGNKTSLQKAVFHHDKTGLDVLFADEGGVTSGDIFGSARFSTFICEIRTTYDFIILDTPPILAVSDARVIAQQADAIIYVVRWNSTSRRFLRAGLEMLRQASVTVTGTTLNRIKSGRGGRYGYYGYGYE